MEELFSLMAQVPPGGRKVLIAPVDFRGGAQTPAAEPWTADLNTRLATALRELPIDARSAAELAAP